MCRDCPHCLRYVKKVKNEYGRLGTEPPIKLRMWLEKVNSYEHSCQRCLDCQWLSYNFDKAFRGEGPFTFGKRPKEWKPFMNLCCRRGHPEAKIVAVKRDVTQVREVEAIVEWLGGMRFTHLATFNFNTKATPGSIRTALCRAHALIDRKLHGRHFHMLPSNQRTFFVGFIEHLHSNTHCHALLRSPARDFNHVAPKVWSKIVPSGQLHLQTPPTAEDIFLAEIGMGKPQALSVDNIVRIARYITKEAHHPQQYESFVLSTEFSPC